MIRYSFSMFEDAGIAPRVDAVIYGIERGLLPASSAAEYEMWAIENLGIEGDNELLISEDDRNEALNALRKAGYVDSGDGGDILRYAALASLSSRGRRLLDDIEQIYADFGYPNDMESLVYYMPNEDENPSPQEIVVRFGVFLASEKNRLCL